MEATTRPRAVDPSCPRDTRSPITAMLRALAWVELIGGIAAALFIWYMFRTTLEAVGVGSPIPVIEYEERTNWIGIGLGAAILLQGLLGYAVLQALASITQDVTGIRISNRVIAEAR